MTDTPTISPEERALLIEQNRVMLAMLNAVAGRCEKADEVRATLAPLNDWMAEVLKLPADDPVMVETYRACGRVCLGMLSSAPIVQVLMQNGPEIGKIDVRPIMAMQNKYAANSLIVLMRDLIPLLEATVRADLDNGNIDKDALNDKSYLISILYPTMLNLFYTELGGAYLDLIGGASSELMAKTTRAIGMVSACGIVALPHEWLDTRHALAAATAIVETRNSDEQKTFDTILGTIKGGAEKARAAFLADTERHAEVADATNRTINLALTGTFGSGLEDLPEA